ncbi:MAG: hypothetical protein ABIX28_00775 [Vicinamibacterales bacterium]
MIHRVATWLAALAIVLSAALGVAAQSGNADAMLGTWSGTWESSGTSGTFALTLAKTEGGALGGKVAVGGEPAYEAALTSVSVEGSKLTAKYDFTPDPRAEVVLTATVEGQTAKGSWSVREKASGTEAVSGSWTVTRK